jgi:sigma-E factor negative regulatory protein RseB
MLRFFSILLFLAVFDGVRAEGFESDPKAVILLEQAAHAANNLNFMGQYVYQHDGQMDIMNIIHGQVNEVSFTKIDSMDGQRREILKKANNLSCVFPDKKLVQIERQTTRTFFPSIRWPSKDRYVDNYQVMLAGSQRVTGRSCQIIRLNPRDQYRYAHEFCLDDQTHLLLKEATINISGTAIMTVEFTSLNFGLSISPNNFNTAYEQSKDWPHQEIMSIQAVNSELDVSVNPPRGFESLGVFKSIGNRQQNIEQEVFSDGLASVSVFIEPADSSQATEHIETLKDTLSYYSAQRSGMKITVLGEVPVDTATRIGHSVVINRRDQKK